MLFNMATCASSLDQSSYRRRKSKGRTSVASSKRDSSKVSEVDKLQDSVCELIDIEHIGDSPPEVKLDVFDLLSIEKEVEAICKELENYCDSYTFGTDVLGDSDPSSQSCFRVTSLDGLLSSADSICDSVKPKKCSSSSRYGLFCESPVGHGILETNTKTRIDDIIGINSVFKKSLLVHCRKLDIDEFCRRYNFTKCSSNTVVLKSTSHECEKNFHPVSQINGEFSVCDALPMKNGDSEPVPLALDPFAIRNIHVGDMSNKKQGSVSRTPLKSKKGEQSSCISQLNSSFNDGDVGREVSAVNTSSGNSKTKGPHKIVLTPCRNIPPNSQQTVHENSINSSEERVSCSSSISIVGTQNESVSPVLSKHVLHLGMASAPDRSFRTDLQFPTDENVSLHAVSGTQDTVINCADILPEDANSILKSFLELALSANQNLLDDGCNTTQPAKEKESVLFDSVETSSGSQPGLKVDGGHINAVFTHGDGSFLGLPETSSEYEGNVVDEEDGYVDNEDYDDDYDDVDDDDDDEEEEEEEEEEDTESDVEVKGGFDIRKEIESIMLSAKPSRTGIASAEKSSFSRIQNNAASSESTPCMSMKGSSSVKVDDDDFGFECSRYNAELDCLLFGSGYSDLDFSEGAENITLPESEPHPSTAKFEDGSSNISCDSISKGKTFSEKDSAGSSLNERTDSRSTRSSPGRGRRSSDATDGNSKKITVKITRQLRKGRWGRKSELHSVWTSETNFADSPSPVSKGSEHVSLASENDVKSSCDSESVKGSKLKRANKRSTSEAQVSKSHAAANYTSGISPSSGVNPRESKSDSFSDVSASLSENCKKKCKTKKLKNIVSGSSLSESNSSSEFASRFFNPEEEEGVKKVVDKPDSHHTSSGLREGDCLSESSLVSGTGSDSGSRFTERLSGDESQEHRISDMSAAAVCTGEPVQHNMAEDGVNAEVATAAAASDVELDLELRGLDGSAKKTSGSLEDLGGKSDSVSRGDASAGATVDQDSAKNEGDCDTLSRTSPVLFDSIESDEKVANFGVGGGCPSESGNGDSMELGDSFSEAEPKSLEVNNNEEESLQGNGDRENTVEGSAEESSPVDCKSPPSTSQMSEIDHEHSPGHSVRQTETFSDEEEDLVRSSSESLSSEKSTKSHVSAVEQVATNHDGVHDADSLQNLQNLVSEDESRCSDNGNLQNSEEQFSDAENQQSVVIGDEEQSCSGDEDAFVDGGNSQSIASEKCADGENSQSTATDNNLGDNSQSSASNDDVDDGENSQNTASDSELCNEGNSRSTASDNEKLCDDNLENAAIDDEELHDDDDINSQSAVSDTEKMCDDGDNSQSAASDIEKMCDDNSQCEKMCDDGDNSQSAASDTEKRCDNSQSAANDIEKMCDDDNSQSAASDIDKMCDGCDNSQSAASDIEKTCDDDHLQSAASDIEKTCDGDNSQSAASENKKLCNVDDNLCSSTSDNEKLCDDNSQSSATGDEKLHTDGGKSQNVLSDDDRLCIDGENSQDSSRGERISSESVNAQEGDDDDTKGKICCNLNTEPVLDEKLHTDSESSQALSTSSKKSSPEIRNSPDIVSSNEKADTKDVQNVQKDISSVTKDPQVDSSAGKSDSCAESEHEKPSGVSPVVTRRPRGRPRKTLGVHVRSLTIQPTASKELATETPSQENRKQDTSPCSVKVESDGSVEMESANKSSEGEPSGLSLRPKRKRFARYSSSEYEKPLEKPSRLSEPAEAKCTKSRNSESTAVAGKNSMEAEPVSEPTPSIHTKEAEEKGEKKPIAASSATTPHRGKKSHYDKAKVIIPFRKGWMREVVHRATFDRTKNVKAIDVYYFTPEGGKLRSMVDVAKYLSEHKELGLTVENFTFVKDKVYREPFEKERGARVKGADGLEPGQSDIQVIAPTNKVPSSDEGGGTPQKRGRKATSHGKESPALSSSPLPDCDKGTSKLPPRSVKRLRRNPSHTGESSDESSGSRHAEKVLNHSAKEKTSDKSVVSATTKGSFDKNAGSSAKTADKNSAAKDSNKSASSTAKASDRSSVSSAKAPDKSVAKPSAKASDRSSVSSAKAPDKSVAKPLEKNLRSATKSSDKGSDTSGEVAEQSASSSKSSGLAKETSEKFLRSSAKARDKSDSCASTNEAHATSARVSDFSGADGSAITGRSKRKRRIPQKYQESAQFSEEEEETQARKKEELAPPPPPAKKAKVKYTLPKQSNASVTKRCSFKCGVSRLQRPSIKCSVCLCLFHPACIPSISTIASVYSGIFTCKPCIDMKTNIQTDKGKESEEEEEVVYLGEFFSKHGEDVVQLSCPTDVTSKTPPLTTSVKRQQTFVPSHIPPPPPLKRAPQRNFQSSVTSCSGTTTTSTSTLVTTSFSSTASLLSVPATGRTPLVSLNQVHHAPISQGPAPRTSLVRFTSSSVPVLSAAPHLPSPVMMSPVPMSVLPRESVAPLPLPSPAVKTVYLLQGSSPSSTVSQAAISAEPVASPAVTTCEATLTAPAAVSTVQPSSSDSVSANVTSVSSVSSSSSTTVSSSVSDSKGPVGISALPATPVLHPASSAQLPIPVIDASKQVQIPVIDASRPVQIPVIDASRSLSHTPMLPQTRPLFAIIQKAVANDTRMIPSGTFIACHGSSLVIRSRFPSVPALSGSTAALQRKRAENCNLLQRKRASIPNILQRKRADAPSTLPGKRADASSTLQGKRADASSTLQGKRADASSTLQGKRTDAPSTLQGKCADVSSTTTQQGKGADASNRLQGKPADTHSTSQGKCADAAGSVQGKHTTDASSTAATQGKSADTSTQEVTAERDATHTVSGKKAGFVRRKRKELATSSSSSDSEYLPDYSSIENDSSSAAEEGWEEVRERVIGEQSKDGRKKRKLRRSNRRRQVSLYKMKAKDQEKGAHDNKPYYSDSASSARSSASETEKCKRLKKRPTSHPKGNAVTSVFLPRPDMNSLMMGYECLNMIFRELKVCDLLRAAQVCRIWRSLTSQNFLWEKVCLQGLHVTDWNSCAEALMKYGTKALNLRSIHINDFKKEWKEFQQSLKHMTGLKHITFGQVPPFVLEAAADSLPLLERLECYCLTDTAERPEMWTTPCKLKFFNIRFLRRLKKLKVRSAGGIMCEEAPHELRFLKDLEHLSFTSLKDFPGNHFSFLNELPNLVTLELGDCCSWTDENYRVLGRLTKLQQLRLENGGGFETGLTQALMKLERLQDLELMKYVIPEDLGRAIKKLSNLQKLSLWPHSTEEPAKVNYNTLQVAPSAKHVSYFCWGIISPDDCIPLLPVLKGGESDSTVEDMHYEDLFDRLCDLMPDSKVEMKCISEELLNKYCSIQR